MSSSHENCGFAYNVQYTQAYQSRIGQKNLNTNINVHLNPSFKESGLQTYIQQNNRLFFVLVLGRIKFKGISDFELKQVTQMEKIENF